MPQKGSSTFKVPQLLVGNIGVSFTHPPPSVVEARNLAAKDRNGSPPLSFPVSKDAAYFSHLLLYYSRFCESRFLFLFLYLQ
jgi:hypothetical protein